MNICSCGHPEEAHLKLKDGTRTCFNSVFDIEDKDPCTCTDFNSLGEKSGTK